MMYLSPEQAKELLRELTGAIESEDFFDKRERERETYD
jgi:hypothetical protein